MKLLRKALALLLCLSLCLTFMPAAFAEGEEEGFLTWDDGAAWEDPGESEIWAEPEPEILPEPETPDEPLFVFEETEDAEEPEAPAPEEDPDADPEAEKPEEEKLPEDREEIVWTYDQEHAVLVLSGKGALPEAGENELWRVFAALARELVLEEGITEIGREAFADFELLERVSLPLSLERIGKDAFLGCEKLESLSYEGTPAQWAAVWIDEGNEALPDPFALSDNAALPSITAQPQNVTAAVGDTAVFTVTASGSGLSYQWQFSSNGGSSWGAAKADGNTTKKLSVPATLSRDGYQYRCKVTNSAGTVTSSAARLTVLEKPSITTQPKNVKVNEGGTAVFTVAASGTGLSYQWQYSKDGGSSWGNASADGNTTKKLSVPGTLYRNGYQYRCKVTNSGGSVYSNAATLTVVAKPSITAHPQNVTAAADDTAVFTVTASGTGLSYQWQYSANGGSSWGAAKADGNTTKKLSVPATLSRDGYQYRCKVTNSAGTVYSNAATLTVLPKPSITAHPQSVKVPEGSTAVFTVTATGSGTSISYQWQYSKDGGSSWASASADGNTTKKLSVPATVSRNGYKYRCKITSGGGTVYSNAATLTVLTRPSITTQPKNAKVPEGSTAVFTVAASSGAGTISYQWQYSKDDGSSWGSASADGSTTKKLSVPATLYRSGYQYRCKLTNDAGTVYSKAVTLTVIGKPVITTQPASAKVEANTNASFTVKASTTSVGGALSYQWQTRTSSSGSWSDMYGSTSATLKVEAYTHMSGWQYRCAVTNLGGTVYTNAATLTVYIKPVIYSQPSDVALAEGGTAVFSVAAYTEQGKLSYQWQYSKDGGSSWASASADGNKTDTLKVPATAGRDGYRYRCVVSNGSASVNSSAAKLTVYVKPTITTHPTNVTASDGASVSFTVKASGSGLSYQWQTRTSSSGSWSDMYGSTSATLKLTAYNYMSGYQYRCAVTNLGGTVHSNAATLTIKVGVPTITSASVSGTSITLYWSSVSSADSYKVYYGTSSSSLTLLKSGITGTSLTVKNLSEQTTYYFAVSAVVSGTEGAKSATVSATTGNVITYRALLIGEVDFVWDDGTVEAATRNRGDVNLMADMLASVEGPAGGKYAVTSRTNVTTSGIRSLISSTFAGADSNDVSLFFFASHGAVDYASGDYAGAMFTYSPGSYYYMTMPQLASWLSDVPGKVIVMIGTCGSGAAVYQSGVAENAVGSAGSGFDPEAFAELCAEAFAAQDQYIESDEEGYIYDEEGNNTAVQPNLGDFCTSKFYVLTAARHQESSWGTEASPSHNYFTQYLALGAQGAADSSGDGAVSLHELFLYIKANATGPYYTYNEQGVREGPYYQHVQEYPKNSSYILFR